MIQSGLRRAIAASTAQAGDGDWIIKSPARRQVFGSRITETARNSDTGIGSVS